MSLLYVSQQTMLNISLRRLYHTHSLNRKELFSFCHSSSFCLLLFISLPYSFLFFYSYHFPLLYFKFDTLIFLVAKKWWHLWTNRLDWNRSHNYSKCHLIVCAPSLLQYTPHPLIPQHPVLSSPLPLCLRRFQEMAPSQARHTIKLVHSSPDSQRPRTPFPHHAAPTSVTACDTTSTLMQPLLHRAHSTYTCKTTVFSLICVFADAVVSDFFCWRIFTMLGDELDACNQYKLL